MKLYNGENWNEVIEALENKRNEIKEKIEGISSEGVEIEEINIEGSEIEEGIIKNFNIEGILKKDAKEIITKGSGLNVSNNNLNIAKKEHLTKTDPHSDSASKEEIKDVDVLNHTHEKALTNLNISPKYHPHEKIKGKVEEAKEAKDIGVDFSNAKTSENSLFLPVGSIVWYAGEDGYQDSGVVEIGSFLVCNGATINKKDNPKYSNLYNAIKDRYAYTNEYSDDISRLPNLSGRFIKGTDLRSHVGYKTEDKLKYHKHKTIRRNNTARQKGLNSNRWRNEAWNWTRYEGTESRPKNIALVPLIKYK